MFPISEPTRGLHLLQGWNTMVFNTPLLKMSIPMLADIFVFSYPIFLVYRYIKGIIHKKLTYKIQALSIFTSAIAGSLLNIMIQFLTDKQRPELYIQNKNHLILSHLPTDPFPSDHACISAAIACATILIAYQTKNVVLKAIGYFFAVASLLMGIARVGVAVHRPTDILIGRGVGIFVGFLVVKRLYPTLEQYGYLKVIAVEEWILEKIKS